VAASPQVDVFAERSLTGNPVAVVHDAVGVSEQEMAAFARWTNLSETTFLLPPTDPGADYRLRIFTPAGELPFAGHPTLGSAHAWLRRGGAPATPDRLVQECGVGLVELRREGDRLAFRAPDLLRSGDVEPAVLEEAVEALGVPRARVLGANWVDNGPGWLGLLLTDAADVLAIDSRQVAAATRLEIGVIGAHDPSSREEVGADYEVRAFCPGMSIREDPATGSLNAGLAMWLTRSGHLPPHYRVRQGTVLGRDGRVTIRTDEHGALWVGGASRTLVEGTLDL
jgi:PhzF family phenazine biosynthesis protein